MKVAINAGIALAIAVSLVSAIIIGTGLHENMLVGQGLSLVFFIGLNIGAVVWALNRTKSEAGYGGQLLNSLVLGVVGGLTITVFSFVMLSFVFPDAIGEMRDAAIDFMEASNMPEAAIQEQADKLDQATPMSQAIPGGIGTFFTSLIVGAIAAIFLRRK